MRLRYGTLNLNKKSFESRNSLFLLLIFTIILIYFLFSDNFNSFNTDENREEEISKLREKFVRSGSLDELLNIRNNSRSILSKNRPMKYETAVTIVVTQNTGIENYDIAIQTVQCYSKIHNYDFVLAIDSDFQCLHKDKFFRRHCVVAKILPRYKTVLFLDADIGVVNPKKKIEDYLSDGIDIYFYDRFYNWEIMAGSYIVRNTKYSIDFLNGFADYEFRIPNSFHGTDNGALHLYLVEQVLPSAKVEIAICRDAYTKSEDFDDLFTYEACIRALLGVNNDFGKVRIMSKGTGWARDDWLTSGKWDPESDFMLHGWKTNQLRSLPDGEIPESLMGNGQWYNPLAGSIHLEKCSPSNSTWLYEPRLLSNKSSISSSLKSFRKEVARNQVASYARILQLLYKTK